MQNPLSSSKFHPLGRKSNSVDVEQSSRNSTKRAATVEPNHHIKLEDYSIREAQIASENQTVVLSEEMPHPVSEVETLHTPTLILTIKLSLEQDKVQTLQISEQDPPTTIAALFCKKHGLDEEVETALASKIEDSIANLNTVEVPCPEPSATVTPPPPLQRDEDVRMSGSTISFLKDMDLNHLYAMNDKYDDPMKSRQRFMNQIVSEISGASEVKACTFKPSLSKNTEKIAQEKSKRLLSPDDSVHQRLYRDAISRKKSAAVFSPPFSPSDSIYSQSPKIKERKTQITSQNQQNAPPQEPIFVKSEADQISQVKISQFLSTTSIVPPNPAMDMSTTNFSHALLNPNSSLNTSSYSGQRMYLNSAKNLHEKQQKLKRMKKELDQKQVKEATFKPTINSRSRQMLPDRQSKNNKTEVLLLEAGAKREAKIKALKQQQEEKSKAKLPFSPSISKNSQIKAKSKRPDYVRQSVHDNLFNEAKKKDRELQEQIRKSSERFNFKPHISRGPRDASQEQVHKRLYANASMKELSVKIEPQVEARPQISRGPRKSHRNGENVFKYLFSQERDRSKSLEQRRVAEQNQLVKKVQEKNYQISRSQEILRNVKEKRVSELFQKLDINNDGLISESSIDITGEAILTQGLNQLELKAIESVLMPLEETGSSMNFDQFYASVNHALPHLEPELKNALVGPHHSRQLAASSDLSFKPSINKKSSSLANIRNSRRPSEGSIWGFLSAQQKIIEEKKKETERSRLQNELKGCTFSPDIAPSPLYRSTQVSFRSEKVRMSPKASKSQTQIVYSSKGAPKAEVLLPES